MSFVELVPLKISISNELKFTKVLELTFLNRTPRFCYTKFRFQILIIHLNFIEEIPWKMNRPKKLKKIVFRKKASQVPWHLKVDFYYDLKKNPT